MWLNKGRNVWRRMNSKFDPFQVWILPPTLLISYNNKIQPWFHEKSSLHDYFHFLDSGINWKQFFKFQINRERYMLHVTYAQSKSEKCWHDPSPQEYCECQSLCCYNSPLLPHIPVIIIVQRLSFVVSNFSYSVYQYNIFYKNFE